MIKPKSEVIMTKLTVKKPSLVKTAILTSSLLAAGLFTSPTVYANNAELNVLTYEVYDSYGIAKALTPLFEKECNCKVKWHFAAQQHLLLNQVALNYKKRSFDVVVGMNYSQTQLANSKKYTNFFAKLEYNKGLITNFPFYSNWSNDLAAPVSYSPVTIAYYPVKTKQKPDTYQSFKDWVEKDTNSFIFGDPRTNDLGANLNKMIAFYYPTAAEQEKAWQLIKNRTITVGKGWSSSYGVFAKGESLAAGAYASSQIYHTLVDKRNDLGFFQFKAGSATTVDSALVTSNAKQPELAQQFVRFMLSQPAQKVLFVYNSSYPVISLNQTNASAAEIALAASAKLYPTLDLSKVTEQQEKSALNAYLKVFAK